ncbi:hypothetical protein C8F01DRAFT_1308471 [Mycena amicta]|nr:hypothetical protein C8F01DRAFT_1308471 [Mycena amicta]
MPKSETPESQEKSKEASPEPQASSSTEAATNAPKPDAETSVTPAADASQPDVEPPADSESSANAPTPATSWQAIYSPQHNTYYFYNTETQETTWTNPLQPPTTEADASTSAQPGPDGLTPNIDPRYAAMQTAALAQGIDPALAYLDPSLAASTSAGLPAGGFQARFNARTGQFTAMDGRTPDHMSEYERAKRMSTVFFDVEAWEKNLAAEKAAEDEAGGKKRKRPSKKDLERFKEQKRLKKIAKTAWLRT